MDALGVGATSGADMVTGMLAGVAAWSKSTPCVSAARRTAGPNWNARRDDGRHSSSGCSRICTRIRCR